MNWGTGIALVYGAFALGMTGVVFASRKHDPGLVQKNYYDLDLNYQARLEQKQHTAALPATPQAQFDANTQSVRLLFPEGMKVDKGAARFFRPATTRDDFTVDINASEAATNVPADKMASGRWRVDLEWESEGKSYFLETAVFVSR